MFSQLTPSSASSNGYVSAHPRGRVVIILLAANAVCSALLILAEVAQLGFPEFAEGQAFDDNPGGLAALLLYFAFTILGAVIFIITTVGFLMWLHRSSSNLPAFGYWKSQGYSPAWAVGSFFVPIANLFMPYQALKEIWQNSRPANSQSFSFSTSPPGFFPAWWAFWLASNFATNIHFRISGEVPHEAKVIVGIVSEVLSIAAAAFAIQVIKEIDERQDETIKHVSPVEERPLPPPPPVFEENSSATGLPSASIEPIR